MGTLAAALAWAQRGFLVFPLAENTRKPAFGDTWVSMATTDPEVIRGWWQDPVLKTEKNYNIGCLCTDMVVVDIDVKKGKDGFNTYRQLGGTFDTLVVRTTTGGFHLYFLGPDSSNSPIADGVDIRSHNGYVVAPGSTIDGSPYYVEREAEMAWVPPAVERLLQPAYVKAALDEENVVLDSPASIEAGKRFLESAPVAVEGQRGDEVTFVTAARLVREMALSVSAAFYLMRDHWNPRCQPPWDAHELLRKVENAHAYGTAILGSLAPEHFFGHLDIQAPPNPFDTLSIGFGNAKLPFAMSPRPWLVDRMLMRRATTVLGAAGSAGKSSVSLALAAHIVQGLDFAGHKAKASCKAIVYNGEDDLDEQSKRLYAVCSAYEFDFELVRSRIMLLSAREFKLVLARKDGWNLVRDDAVVDALIQKASDPDIGLIVLDPLVKLHQLNESDSIEMDFVMDTLNDIAYKADVAILALHHTNKVTMKQEERIGNVDIFRGSSAISNAARVAYTLFNATLQDVEDYGLQEHERHTWVRMDDAKMNFSLANNDKATWFRKQGIHIPSTDIVGVLKYEVLEKSRNHMRLMIARALIDTMTINGSATMTLTEAGAVLRNTISLLANKTDIELKRQVEGTFSTPVVYQQHTLTIKRDADKTKAVLILS